MRQVRAPIHRLFARMRPIAVRVPAFMAIVAVCFVAVAVISFTWIRHSTEFLFDLDRRDLQARELVTHLYNDLDVANTRILGVMAKVYASSGSADRVAQTLKAIEKGWSELASVIPKEEQGKAFADATAAMAAIGPFAARIDTALRNSKPLPDLYDQWLDITPPLRKAIKEVTEQLDHRIHSRVERDLKIATLANNATFVAGGLSLAILIWVSWNLAYRVARPIGRMTSVMSQLAKGDLDCEVEFQNRQDEIGAMARALEVFKQDELAARALEEKQRQQEEKQRRQQTIDDHIAAFDRCIREELDVLTKHAVALRATAQEMSAAAASTSQQGNTVSANSEQALVNAQTVASAAEQLSGSASDIARQISHSAAIAGRAVEEAVRTNAKMEGLTAAAQQIGEVVRLIQSIAGQTNLLALNATIEAARAGEYGRGFAVVANEVKALASETAKATDDIGRQVHAMQTATAEVVTVIRTIGSTIDEMNGISGRVAAAVEQQAGITGEITRNTQQTSEGTQEVVRSIAEVNRAAATTGTAASKVLDAASELGNHTDRLRTEIDQFLDRIRAA